VRVTATRAPEALEGLFRSYMEDREDDEESFRDWVGRVGDKTVTAVFG